MDINEGLFKPKQSLTDKKREQEMIRASWEKDKVAPIEMKDS